MPGDSVGMVPGAGPATFVVAVSVGLADAFGVEVSVAVRVGVGDAVEVSVAVGVGVAPPCGSP
jgi:hypothetical protein